MKQLLVSFPWRIPILCLLGWLTIIIIHAVFVAVAPKENGQVDVVFAPEKKRIIEDGNNLFVYSLWNLILLAIAHFIRIWEFIPWVTLIISAFFALIALISFVPYFISSVIMIFFDKTCFFRAKILILLSILTNLICTVLMVYPAYSMYMIYIN